MTCRVAYANEQHQGLCRLPSCYPATFVFMSTTVTTGLSVAKCYLSVTRCPENYYFNQSLGECGGCHAHVTCAVGSSISDWQLVKGYWRSGDESEDIRACRFGLRSCPGAGRNQATGRDAFCGPEYVTYAVLSSEFVATLVSPVRRRLLHGTGGRCALPQMCHWRVQEPLANDRCCLKCHHYRCFHCARGPQVPNARSEFI